MNTGSVRRRRHWPWVVGGVVVAIAVAAVVVGVTADHARQVTLREAEAHSGGGAGGAATNGRPTPGVYAYTGSGTERLSLPPLSQPEGPTIPGTVSLVGADCWVLRLDYSTHHWQTWRYCQHGADLWEMGGTTWLPVPARRIALAAIRARRRCPLRAPSAQPGTRAAPAPTRRSPAPP